MDQVVELGHLAVGVGQDGEVDLGVLGLVDVLDPLGVGLDRIDADGDGLDAPLGEFGLERSSTAQFGGADGGEIRRMGKQHDPAVASPGMELNVALTRSLFEIGSLVAQTKSVAHWESPKNGIRRMDTPIVYPSANFKKYPFTLNLYSDFI